MKLRTANRKIARKKIRVKRLTPGSLKGTFVETRNIDAHTPKTIKLAVVSHKQQMRERNNAYHFFSLD